MDTEKFDIEALRHTLEMLTAFRKEHPDKRDEFNVFRAMRTSTDEVRLHSRFIASLLDPDAPHGLGTLPLELFLKEIKVPEYIYQGIIDARRIDIYPNYQRKAEHEHIDILIKSDTHAVIIENKINAADGLEQIKRYYVQITQKEAYAKKNVAIYYLAREGKNPSEYSTMDIANRVVAIRYEKEILGWLRKILESRRGENPVYAYIEQYSETIKDIAMCSDEVNERKELLEKVGSLNDNELKSLEYLLQNEKHIRWHALDEYLRAVIDKLSDGGIEDVVVRSSSKEDTSDKYMQIANGLKAIIHDKKAGRMEIVFSGDSELKPYIIISNTENAFFGFNDTNVHAATEHKRMLLKEVKDYLENNGFRWKDGYYWKYFEYTKGVCLDPNSLTGLLLKMTNAEVRGKVVDETVRQIKKWTKEVAKRLPKE